MCHYYMGSQKHSDGTIRDCLPKRMGICHRLQSHTQTQPSKKNSLTLGTSFRQRIISEMAMTFVLGAGCCIKYISGELFSPILLG